MIAKEDKVNIITMDINVSLVESPVAIAYPTVAASFAPLLLDV